MARSILKLSIGVLVLMALVASIGLFFFRSENDLTIKSIVETASCTTTDLASGSSMLTSKLLSNDTNWAGYIVASDLQNPQASITSISASWTVPAVTISTQDTFSAIWIGIGGFFDNTLIQAGTEQDSIQGQSEYSAWLELLPQNSFTIDTLSVSPGDQIYASIQLVDANKDQWSIYIKDTTNNQEYTGSYFYAASQQSAEWIVERPDLSSSRSRNTLTSLADVGDIEFTKCQAIVDGKNGTVSSFPNVRSIMYETVQSTTDAGSTQLATVSDLTAEGSSFTVETSLSTFPELPVLLLILLIGAIVLLTTLIMIKKRVHFQFLYPKNHTKHILQMYISPFCHKFSNLSNSYTNSLNKKQTRKKLTNR